MTTPSPRPHTLTFERTLPQGPVVFGATVETFASDATTEDDGTLWVELAYSVSMADSDVTLSKEDFERCIANFARYPCVPVVIEHADTDWWCDDTSWKEPHGYVEELALGTRIVTEMNGSTREATTLRGRVSFDDATRPLVGAKKKWRWGSITMVKGAADEATGTPLGAMLWSWSLTAHPRLTALAPIEASLRDRIAGLDEHQREALLAALARSSTPIPASTSTPTPQPPESTTMKYLELAARLGLSATSEDDARDKITALLHLGADALRALGLSLTTTAADVAKTVATLTSAASRLPTLETELATFRAERETREKTERAAWLDDVITAKPELAAVRPSLTLHAERDWNDFQKHYPRPTRDELATAAAERAQRSQDPARMAPVTTATNPGNPATKDAPKPPQTEKTVSQHATEIVAVYREYGATLSVIDALAMAQRGETAEKARAWCLSQTTARA